MFGSHDVVTPPCWSCAASTWQSKRGRSDFDLVVDQMSSVYHDKVYWWESVLLLQRLLPNVVATFGKEVPLIRSIATISVCIFFLSLHISVQPLRCSSGGVAQTTFQVSVFVKGPLKGVCWGWGQARGCTGCIEDPCPRALLSCAMLCHPHTVASPCART